MGEKMHSLFIGISKIRRPYPFGRRGARHVLMDDPRGCRPPLGLSSLGGPESYHTIFQELQQVCKYTAETAGSSGITCGE